MIRNLMSARQKIARAKERLSRPKIAAGYVRVWYGEAAKPRYVWLHRANIQCEAGHA